MLNKHIGPWGNRMQVEDLGLRPYAGILFPELVEPVWLQA